MGKALNGEIEYQNGLPEAINEAEASQGFVLLCSAHALSDLMIELSTLGAADD